MPIARLFIEGSLEAEILNPILQGAPVLQRGGSKNGLKPRALTERKENKVAAGYLRDRDFDYEPPDDLSQPTVDYLDGGTSIGWRWCRHEIENYLIDPLLVSAAMAWPITDIEDALRQSARKIRYYEAARWTVGIVRRTLPPHFKLNTRPDDLNEIALPSALDSISVNEWALKNIDTHRSCIEAKSNPQSVLKSLEFYSTLFEDVFISDVSKVLLWFSGKDLLAGMSDWLMTKNMENPGAYRAALRDWIISNPEQTLEILPEWKSLTEVLRS